MKIHFFLSEAKKRNEEIITLENKMKTFEENFTNNESNQGLKCKRNLN